MAQAEQSWDLALQNVGLEDLMDAAQFCICTEMATGRSVHRHFNTPDLVETLHPLQSRILYNPRYPLIDVLNKPGRSQPCRIAFREPRVPSKPCADGVGMLDLLTCRDACLDHNLLVRDSAFDRGGHPWFMKVAINASPTTARTKAAHGRTDSSNATVPMNCVLIFLFLAILHYSARFDPIRITPLSRNISLHCISLEFSGNIKRSLVCQLSKGFVSIA